MPWKVESMSEQRLVLVQLIEQQGFSVAAAARELNVSRKTAYKWLSRYRQDPACPLDDLTRRPRRSPRRTSPQLEERILDVQATYGWGARKVWAYFRNNGVDVPSRRTVHAILERNGRVVDPTVKKPTSHQSFERSSPNELWQLDHKGPLEVGRRRRHPLTVIDDHSRYLLVIKLCDDVGHQAVWEHLWTAFGDCGLPDSILSDNSFGAKCHPRTISRFESKLIRLGINPIHGRPYHPQTQGKVERIHGTFERELYPHARRDSVEHFEQDAYQWRTVYNTVRPHEAVDDRPPITRWRPSPRPRPAELPEVEYEPGAVVRTVNASGDLYHRGYKILAGAGLAKQRVRIHEEEGVLALYYSWKLIRRIHTDDLRKGVIL